MYKFLGDNGNIYSKEEVDVITEQLNGHITEVADDAIDAKDIAAEAADTAAEAKETAEGIDSKATQALSASAQATEDVSGLLALVNAMQNAVQTATAAAQYAQQVASSINLKISENASEQNKLMDKAFINSSIASSTANFLGTNDTATTEAQFLTWADALTNKTNNDYTFWQTTDSSANVLFKRYKYNGTAWIYEYTLNNSSFTAAQWAALNSGISDTLVTKIGEVDSKININGNNATQAGVSTMLNKLTAELGDPVDDDYFISQYANGGSITTTYHRRPVSKLFNYIKNKLATVAHTGSYNDLSNRPSLATVATSGSYNDLINKPASSTFTITKIDGSYTAKYFKIANFPSVSSVTNIDAMTIVGTEYGNASPFICTIRTRDSLVAYLDGNPAFDSMLKMYTLSNGTIDIYLCVTNAYNKITCTASATENVTLYSGELTAVTPTGTSTTFTTNRLFLSGVSSSGSGNGIADITRNGRAVSATKAEFVKSFTAPAAKNIDAIYDASFTGLNSSSTGTFPANIAGSKASQLITMPYRKGSGNTTPDFCNQILFPNGDNPTDADSMFFRTSGSSSWRPWQKVSSMLTSYVTIQTGSSKQQRITLQTLVTYLMNAKYISSGWNDKVICTSWSYGDNDILRLTVGTTNYELQLAGVVIEVKGFVTDYTTGIYRMIIHSSPTTSFTPSSGYTAFPASTVAEYTCNGSGYTPTWKIYNTNLSASVSVGSSTGTPSASVAVTYGATTNFAFTFNNLKGATGPQGPQGPAGTSVSASYNSGTHTLVIE